MTATLERRGGGAAHALPGSRRRHRNWPLVGAVLIGQLLVLADLDIPVLRPLVAAAVLLGVPTLTLARRTLAGLPDRQLAFLFAVGGTLLGVIGVALALNTALPYLGDDRPLARPVLVAASTAIDLALLLKGSTAPLVPAGAVRAFGRAVGTARLVPDVSLGALAVLLAVTGAIRLNNHQGGAVAATAHAVSVVALVVCFARRPTANQRSGVTVYLVALALLLGTSLRGWYITGHDIQNEYLSFLYTQRAEHWVMSAYPTPYNACLSVNILPSVLSHYLGVDGVVVFKVVMQLVFALVPVCVFTSARWMFQRRAALVAAAMFMFFPTFFTDMPFLVRQEVAFLFVALAMLAASARGLSVRMRQGATLAFGLGVVLSHYSTTYLLVVTLVLGMLGAAKWRTVEQGRLVLLAPLVVLAISGAAWAWSTPLTHSGGHLVDTVSGLTRSIINGNLQSGSSDLKYSPLGGGPSAQDRFDSYLAAAAKQRASAGNPAQYVFPAASPAVAHPPLATPPPVPRTALGRELGPDLPRVNATLRVVMGGLIEVFLLVGLVAMVRRSRGTRLVSREQFWLALGSLGALAVIIGVPGLSADYGVLRAFQQTLLFAAPLVGVGFLTALRPLGRAALPAVGALVAAMGLVLTGAQAAATGAHPGQLSQDDSGQYYELLYVDSPEISAARWLATTTAGAGPQYVTASDIVSVTRLQSMLPATVMVNGDFLPSLLVRGTYVFLGAQTAVHGRATVFYTGDLITYAYPTGAVEGTLDVVYSSGSAEILR